MVRLPTHQVFLRDGHVRLRPFTEEDWESIYHWFADPEVLYYSEGAENPQYTRDEIQDIYRGTANQGALLFIIETTDGKAIGETWLQPMNLDRGFREPRDCAWRIDIMIGEKTYWGKGYGRHAVGLLLRHAFEVLDADRVAAMCVSEFNIRSLRMFGACGMRVVRRVSGQVPREGRRYAEIDLEITRSGWPARPEQHLPSW